MIAWIDVETTGLDERTGHLLEVAMVVTTDALDEVAFTSHVVAPVGRSIDDVAMEDVVREMHSKSGLLDLIRKGQCVRRYEAAEALIAFCGALQRAGAWDDEMVVGGSSVGFDRRWLRHHMPVVEGLFHHRSIDVSSITELARRWAPAIYEGRPKKEAPAHRALEDVRESIAYLRYYWWSGFLDGATP